MFRNDMAKAALRLILLLLLAFAFDRAGSWLLRTALPHSQFRFSSAARGGLPSQILILGDSRAVACISAPSIQRLTSQPVMNLGYNGMSTLIAEAVLRDYLARNPSPKMIVVEVTSTMASQSLLDGLMCYWDFYPSLASLADTLSPRNRLAIRLSHLFAFNGEIPLRALYYARHSDQDWLNHYRALPALLAATRTEQDYDLASRPENLAALGRITRLAADRHIPVRLVIAPYLRAHLAHARNWVAWCRQIERAAGGAPLWDYSGALDHPELFADRLHLNDQGAPRFVSVMVQDHLFDPNVRSKPAGRVTD